MQLGLNIGLGTCATGVSLLLQIIIRTYVSKMNILIEIQHVSFSIVMVIDHSFVCAIVLHIVAFINNIL